MARIDKEFMMGHRILCSPSTFGGWNLKSAGFKRPARTFDQDMIDALTRLACVMPGDTLSKGDMTCYKAAWAALENANDDDWRRKAHGKEVTHAR